MTVIKSVEHVRLGQTSLSVSNICFGTASLANMPLTYGYDVDEGRAQDTLQAIFDGPGNFLDTSRNYGFGRAEMLIGQAIRARGGLPDGFVISTKLDRDPKTDHFDASQARRSLDESLQALGLDRIPLLHLHDPEHAASLSETSGAVSELFKMKEEGLCDAVGLAAGDVRVMMPILKGWEFDALITHNRFTLINRNAENMIAYAHAKGIAVLNAAPYNSGILAKGAAEYPRFAYQSATEATLEPVRRIQSVCARYGIPIGAAALQFSLRDERITSTICGVTRPERIAQTLEWAHWPIGDDVWEALGEIPFAKDDPEASRDYQPG